MLPRRFLVLLIPLHISNVSSIYTFDIFPGPNGPTIKKNEESNAFRGKLVFIPLHSSLLGQCRIPTAWWVRPVPRERRIADSRYCGCTVSFWRFVLTVIEGQYEAWSHESRVDARAVLAMNSGCCILRHHTLLCYVISLFEFGLW